jgi:hypothetical protein
MEIEGDDVGSKTGLFAILVSIVCTYHQILLRPPKGSIMEQEKNGVDSKISKVSGNKPTKPGETVETKSAVGVSTHFDIPSTSHDLKVQGDGSFTPYALKKIEEVFTLFDEDQDGMWNVTEWNEVSSALGEQSRVDVGQLRELAKSVDGVSLHDGKGFRLDSVINIFKASDDLESDLHKIEKHFKTPALPKNVASVGKANGSVGKANVSVGKETAARMLESPRMPMNNPFKEGQRVEVRLGSRDGIEKARITWMSADGKCDVRYDDGEVERGVDPALIKALEEPEIRGAPVPSNPPPKTASDKNAERTIPGRNMAALVTVSCSIHGDEGFLTPHHLPRLSVSEGGC